MLAFLYSNSGKEKEIPEYVKFLQITAYVKRLTVKRSSHLTVLGISRKAVIVLEAPQ